MTVSKFRGLVTFWMISGIAAGVVDGVFPNLVPEDLYALYIETDSPLDQIGDVLLLVVAILFLVATITATVGLYLIRRWARTLTLWLSIITVASLPMLGPTLQSGVATSITIFHTILWGAILTAMYHPDISEHFGESP